MKRFARAVAVAVVLLFAGPSISPASALVCVAVGRPADLGVCVKGR